MAIPVWPNLRTVNGCPSAKLMMMLLCSTGLVGAAVLPDAAGKAETVKLCGRCHSLEVATSLRQGQQGWTETISKMVNLGAQGSDEDLHAVLNYLAKFYGPVRGALEGGSTGRTEAAVPVITDGTAALSPGIVNIASRLPKQADAERIAALTAEGVPADSSKEWPTYGHDAGAMRFSPLTQITPRNVGRLKLAWAYHMKPPGYTAPPRGRGPAVMEGRAPGGARPVGDEPEAPPASARGGRREGRMQFGSGYRPSQVTPVVIGGIMYVTTPYSRVAALDPVNGVELWSWQLPSGNPSTRGLEYWPGDGKTPAQIVFGSTDGKLYSLDAKTGIPNPAFGDNGVVNLNTDSIMRGLPGRNAMTSPPIVYKNVVITGGTT
ncbi:MAG: hypothetical protein ACRD7E_07935, partial [Bryobacteraceae bacterium]